MMPAFPPTRAAALKRIAALNPRDYARSRNALEGHVSYLSPYITHGMVTPAEIVARIAHQHPLSPQDQFVYELGWREYFREVWRQRGDGIFQSLHAGPMPDSAYATVLPLDIRRASTGVAVVDQAVRQLYACGYLHNHARMWLASYIVHVRHVHWRAGADWMVSHLLDGDLASNHLSWQWVAGTASSKPYLFNAENVARHAPPAWHSAGSVIDTSYAALLGMASGDLAAHAPSRTDGTWTACSPLVARDGVDEPALGSRPPAADIHPPPPRLIAGRDLWLVHPWGLRAPPAELSGDLLCIGWWPAECHAAWPWSQLRWQFASRAMATLTPHTWYGSAGGLSSVLAGARSVHTWADPHIDAKLPAQVIRHVPPPLFAPVDQPCGSFSQWWRHSMRAVHSLADLPGMRA